MCGPSLCNGCLERLQGAFVSYQMAHFREDLIRVASFRCVFLYGTKKASGYDSDEAGHGRSAHTITSEQLTVRRARACAPFLTEGSHIGIIPVRSKPMVCTNVRTFKQFYSSLNRVSCCRFLPGAQYLLDQQCLRNATGATCLIARWYYTNARSNL